MVLTTFVIRILYGGLHSIFSVSYVKQVRKSHLYYTFINYLLLLQLPLPYNAYIIITTTNSITSTIIQEF